MPDHRVQTTAIAPSPARRPYVCNHFSSDGCGPRCCDLRIWPRVPIAKEDAHLLRDFAAALTNAMKQGGVRRAVVVSTAFLFKDSLIPPVYLLGRLLFPGVVSDATDMERILSGSARHPRIKRVGPKLRSAILPRNRSLKQS